MNEFPLAFTCQECYEFIIHRGELNGLLLKSCLKFKKYYCIICFEYKLKEHNKCVCINCRKKEDKIRNSELFNL